MKAPTAPGDRRGAPKTPGVPFDVGKERGSGRRCDPLGVESVSAEGSERVFLADLLPSISLGGPGGSCWSLAFKAFAFNDPQGYQTCRHAHVLSVSMCRATSVQTFTCWVNYDRLDPHRMPARFAVVILLVGTSTILFNAR